jgi:GNAT superfamily N-acetyltransferase
MPDAARPTTQPPNIAFRPARPQDKPRMLEITANTWGDGWDYIPDVWEDWLADPQGEFTVAELDGVVIALAKLTAVGEGQWWMEGLRVDPERRLKGVGQAMNAYQVQLARQLGGRVVRYAAGIRNQGSHRIAEKAGFTVLTRFVERAGAKLDEPVTGLEQLTVQDLAAAWELGRDSDLVRAAHGAYIYLWKSFELTRERLAEHLVNGQVVGIRDEVGRLCSWCLVHFDPAWERMSATSLAGAPDGITRLGRALRAQAAVLGKTMVEVMINPVPRALTALTAAGYFIEPDPKHPEVQEHGIDVLELRLDRG